MGPEGNTHDPNNPDHAGFQVDSNYVEDDANTNELLIAGADYTDVPIGESMALAYDAMLNFSGDQETLLQELVAIAKSDMGAAVVTVISAALMMEAERRGFVNPALFDSFVILTGIQIANLGIKTWKERQLEKLKEATRTKEFYQGEEAVGGDFNITKNQETTNELSDTPIETYKPTAQDYTDDEDQQTQ